MIIQNHIKDDVKRSAELSSADRKCPDCGTTGKWTIKIGIIFDLPFRSMGQSKVQRQDAYGSA
jgi:hypothetical protein